MNKVIAHKSYRIMIGKHSSVNLTQEQVTFLQLKYTIYDNGGFATGEMQYCKYIGIAGCNLMDTRNILNDEFQIDTFINFENR